MGCLFRLQQGNRLIRPRTDRKGFAAHKPSRDAHGRHTLKYPPKTIALTEAFVPGSKHCNSAAGVTENPDENGDPKWRRAS